MAPGAIDTRYCAPRIDAPTQSDVVDSAPADRLTGEFGPITIDDVPGHNVRHQLGRLAALTGGGTTERKQGEQRDDEKHSRQPLGNDEARLLPDAGGWHGYHLREVRCLTRCHFGGHRGSRCGLRHRSRSLDHDSSRGRCNRLRLGILFFGNGHFRRFGCGRCCRHHAPSGPRRQNIIDRPSSLGRPRLS